MNPQQRLSTHVHVLKDCLKTILHLQPHTYISIKDVKPINLLETPNICFTIYIIIMYVIQCRVILVVYILSDACGYIWTFMSYLYDFILHLKL